MDSGSSIDEATVLWGVETEDIAQALADDNLAAQAHMWEALREALRLSGQSLEVVAGRIGISPELVQTIVDGRIDITLSDLRELAYALDASITYRVTPRYSPNMDTFRKSLNAIPDHWYASHLDNDEVDSLQELATESR